MNVSEKSERRKVEKMGRWEKSGARDITERYSVTGIKIRKRCRSREVHSVAKTRAPNYISSIIFTFLVSFLSFFFRGISTNILSNPPQTPPRVRDELFTALPRSKLKIFESRCFHIRRDKRIKRKKMARLRHASPVDDFN